ncbi:hypothetical protein SNEBB_007417 [Seison nebaliae]|nr:hypothetical protein SNEBB_007417 [Seison nebaliae]
MCSRIGKAFFSLPSKTQVSRPMTAYTLFVKEKFQLVRNEQKNKSVPDVMKLVASEWSKISANEKESYERRAKILKLNDEKREKINQLSSSEKKELRERKKERKRVLELKKEAQSLNKPLRPPNSFLLYLQSLERPPSNEVSAVEFVKNAAGKWKELPDGEREKWRLEHVEAMKEYTTNLVNWEKRMVSEGKDYLCRSRKP